MTATQIPTANPTRPRVDLEEVPDSAFGAALYNSFLWLGERRGMAARRRRLLAKARGRVLEVGAGTGLNLRYYPERLERLVIAEPAAHMAARIDPARRPGPEPAEVVNARAEELPFEDDSFDTVVSTLVLCTVQDPELAVAEIARVLRPGGRLLFCEHVHADPGMLRNWQDRLAEPWAAFAGGCRCDRSTLETIGERLRIVMFDREKWTGMTPIVRPLVVGEAQV